MNKKWKQSAVVFTLIVCMAMTGCSKTADTTSAADSATTDDDGIHASTSAVTLTEGDYGNNDMDAAFDEDSALLISCNKDSIETSGAGVSTSGQTATISAGGTYILSGELTDGQIIVNAPEKDVQLVFRNISIANSKSAPIYVMDAKNVVITLAEGTSNYMEDGEVYEFDNTDQEPSAAIFSKDDLTFNGSGSLEVVANFNNGIQSKDDLKFISGTYVITAKDDGIVGKDSVSVKDGTFQITTESDGIKATNTSESDKGYVMIDGGNFAITSGNDGVQAETLLRINNGIFDITAGEGYTNAVLKTGEGNMSGDWGGQKGGMGRGEMTDEASTGEAPTGEASADEATTGEASTVETPPEKPSGDTTADGEQPQMPSGDMPADSAETANADSTETDSTETTESTKGLKSYVDVIIEAGTFTINSADDTIHSNHDVTIDGGKYELQAGDDGIHADNVLTIQKGDINISTSYEGIEACTIIVNDGNVTVTASDDGFNSVNGDDGDSAAVPEEEDAAETEEQDVDAADTDTGAIDRKQPGNMGGGMGMDSDDGSTITINGGNIKVTASGDGLDSNGSITMTGGTVEVQGPTNGGNGTLDYSGTFTLTGGSFFGIGSSQMAQNPSDGSTQIYIVGNLENTIAAGTSISVSDESGDVICSYTAEVQGQWMCISSPEFQDGMSYTVKAGDDSYTVTIDGVANAF